GNRWPARGRLVPQRHRLRGTRPPRPGGTPAPHPHRHPHHARAGRGGGVGHHGPAAPPPAPPGHRRVGAADGPRQVRRASRQDRPPARLPDGSLVMTTAMSALARARIRIVHAVLVAAIAAVTLESLLSDGRTSAALAFVPVLVPISMALLFVVHRCVLKRA